VIDFTDEDFADLYERAGIKPYHLARFLNALHESTTYALSHWAALVQTFGVVHDQTYEDPIETLNNEPWETY